MSVSIPIISFTCYSFIIYVVLSRRASSPPPYSMKKSTLSGKIMNTEIGPPSSLNPPPKKIMESL